MILDLSIEVQAGLRRAWHAACKSRFPALYMNSMSADTDRLLVQQIRRGDADAWFRLIERYEGRLLAFAHRRLRDRSSAEDVMQETFIGFHNSLPNYDENRDLQTYLFTIAAHKLTDFLRRTGRHPLQNLPDGQEFFEQQTDRRKGVSSMARSAERKAIESGADTIICEQ